MSIEWNFMHLILICRSNFCLREIPPVADPQKRTNGLHLKQLFQVRPQYSVNLLTSVEMRFRFDVKV